MARIPLLDPTKTTGKTQELLNMVKSKFGAIPNIFKVMSNSPVALETYFATSGAITGSTLTPKLKEQIALTCAEITKCAYCLSAHTVMATKAGLSSDDINSARACSSNDPKVDAVLKFTKSVVKNYGAVSNDELKQLMSVGYSNGEILEIVAVISLNLYTNIINHVADTDIDFPPVQPKQSCCCHQ